MTNKEYLGQLIDELFGLNPEVIETPEYAEFEHYVEEIMREDFAKLGCDTSEGRPTWLATELWMNWEVNKKMQETFEKKYRKQ